MGRGEILVLALMGWGLGGVGAPPEEFSARLEVREQTRNAIRVKLTIRNESPRSLILALGGRPAYNILVKRPDGMLVWEWQRGKIIQQILEHRHLAPGEEVTFDATWRYVDARGRRVPAGDYVIQGIVNLEPPETLATDTLRVRVPPRKRP
jgi:hypothetical protein